MNTFLLVASISSRVESSEGPRVKLACMPPRGVVDTLSKTHRIIVFQDENSVFARRTHTMLVEEDGDSSDEDDEWEDVARPPPRVPLVIDAPRRPRPPDSRRLPGFRVSYASVIDAPWNMDAVYWRIAGDAWRVRCSNPKLFLQDPLFTALLRPGDAFITTPCDTRPPAKIQARDKGVVETGVWPGENLTCVPIDDSNGARIPILVADDNTKCPCRDGVGHTAFQLPLDTPPPVDKDTRVAVYRHGATPVVKSLWAAVSPALGPLESFAAIAELVGQAGCVPDKGLIDDYKQAKKEAWEANTRIFKAAVAKKKMKKRRRNACMSSHWSYLTGERRRAIEEATRTREAEEDTRP